MAEKRNIFLVGPMGAGKSTIGRHLAQMLHLEFHDSDQEIEQRTGADIAWVFDVEGEEGFRRREAQVIADLSENKVSSLPPVVVQYKAKISVIICLLVALWFIWKPLSTNRSLVLKETSDAHYCKWMILEKCWRILQRSVIHCTKKLPM